jgi:dephospho-CoA kinase
MGSLPADAEQFLLIEDSIVEIEKLVTRVDDMMNNKVNIERLIKDVDKLTEQLEILKDKVRDNGSYKQ